MMRINLAKVLLPMFLAALVVFMLAGFHQGSRPATAQEKGTETEVIKLPAPKLDGEVSVEKALAQRRSVRTYKDEPLTIAEVSQILWAAQGITDPETGKRTAPSPRAMYLLDTYLICGDVKGLAPGMYQYQPKGHGMTKIMDGEAKAKLFDAAGQAPIQKAPVALLLVGQSDRSRSPSMMYLEAGHVAENVYLQAVSLNLGTVVMAGFEPEEVRKALELSEDQMPIYIMPLGRK